MTLRSFARHGGRLLALVALLMASHAHANPAADVQLNTDLNRMSIHVGQGAPLPPGGCQAGYAWHTTYGGCRRRETVTESAPCPTGQTGSRTRQRTDYILQADAANVAHGPWGQWQDACQRPRLTGVMDGLIASVRGNGPGNPPPDGAPLSKNLARLMRVGGYFSRYGVTLDRPSAKLNCVYSRSTAEGGGEANPPMYWHGVVLKPGQSIDVGYIGACLLSSDGTTAMLRGNCDSTSGGDADQCLRAVRTVRIIDTSPCIVTTQTEHQVGSSAFPIPPAVNRYNLCE